MNAAAVILVFISFWSITAVGVYLAVVGLDNLGRHDLASRGPAARGYVSIVRRLSPVWDAVLLLLGALLAASGVLFLYMVAYG